MHHEYDNPADLAINTPSHSSKPVNQIVHIKRRPHNCCLTLVYTLQTLIVIGFLVWFSSQLKIEPFLVKTINSTTEPETVLQTVKGIIETVSSVVKGDEHGTGLLSLLDSIRRGRDATRDAQNLPGSGSAHKDTQAAPFPEHRRQAEEPHLPGNEEDDSGESNARKVHTDTSRLEDSPGGKWSAATRSASRATTGPTVAGGSRDSKATTVFPFSVLGTETSPGYWSASGTSYDPWPYPGRARFTASQRGPRSQSTTSATTVMDRLVARRQKRHRNVASRGDQGDPESSPFDDPTFTHPNDYHHQFGDYTNDGVDTFHIKSQPPAQEIGKSPESRAQQGQDSGEAVMRHRRDAEDDEDTDFGVTDESMPKNIPYTTFLQKGSVSTDVSFGLIRTTFNYTIFSHLDSRFQQLLTALSEASLVVAGFKQYVPIINHPELRMIETIRRKHSIFSSRWKQFRTITTRPVLEDSSKWNEPAKRRSPFGQVSLLEEFLATHLSDPYLINLAGLSVGKGGFPTWKDLIRQFPPPECGFAFGEDCSARVALIDNLSIAVEQFAKFPTSANYNDVVKVVQELSGRPIFDVRKNLKKPTQRPSGSGNFTEEPIDYEELVTLPSDYFTNLDTTQSRFSRDKRSTDNHTYVGSRQELPTVVKRGAVAVGVKILGIVFSLFTGMSGSGFGFGSSSSETEEIERAIEKHIVETVPVGFEGFQENARTGSYSDLPASHSDILEDYVDQAQAAMLQANNALSYNRNIDDDKDFNFLDYYNVALAARISNVYINTLTTHIAPAVQALDEYITYGNRLLDGFESALRGEVPGILFTTGAVRKALQDLDNTKAQEYVLLLNDEISTLSRFYTLKTTIIGHSDSSLMTIVVMVPMVNVAESYSLYQFTPTPTYVGPDDLMIEVVPEARMILTDSGHSQMRSLTALDLSQCAHVGTRYLCPDLKLFRKTSTCLKALLTNKQDDIFRLCRFRFVRKSGTLITRYDLSKYIFRSNRRRTIMLQCYSADSHHSKTIHIKEGENRLQFPPTCGATIDGTRIAPSGYLTPGDPALGKLFLHLIMVTTMDDLWTALSTRYPNLDFSEAGRQRIHDTLEPNGLPLSFDQLGETTVIVKEQTTTLFHNIILSLIIIGFILALIFIKFKVSYYPSPAPPALPSNRLRSSQDNLYETLSPEPMRRAPELQGSPGRTLSTSSRMGSPSGRSAALSLLNDIYVEHEPSSNYGRKSSLKPSVIRMSEAGCSMKRSAARNIAGSVETVLTEISETKTAL